MQYFANTDKPLTIINIFIFFSLSMTTKYPNDKACGTCKFWTGESSLCMNGRMVQFESTGRFKCGLNGATVLSGDHCYRWQQKW